MSAIVESFQRITRDRPDRPLVFLAGTGQALTAADLWRAHEIEMARLREAGLGPGDLLLSATGNRPDLIARAVACRALDIALMAVDAGATPIGNRRAQRPVRRRGGDRAAPDH